MTCEATNAVAQQPKLYNGLTEQEIQEGLSKLGAARLLLTKLVTMKGILEMRLKRALEHSNQYSEERLSDASVRLNNLSNMALELSAAIDKLEKGLDEYVKV